MIVAVVAVVIQAVTIYGHILVDFTPLHFTSLRHMLKLK